MRICLLIITLLTTLHATNNQLDKDAAFRRWQNLKTSKRTQTVDDDITISEGANEPPPPPPPSPALSHLPPPLPKVSEQLAQFNDIRAACWLGHYRRGVGLPRTECSPKRVKEQGLCYHPCPPDYPVRGGILCWTKWSPKHRPHAHHRGMGVIPKYCPTGLESHQGLCYKPCKEQYKGVGPLCHSRTCPTNFPYKCGAICTASKSMCRSLIFGLVTSGISKSVASTTWYFYANTGSAGADVVGKMTSWPACDELDHSPAKDSGGEDEEKPDPMHEVVEGMKSMTDAIKDVSASIRELTATFSGGQVQSRRDTNS